MYEEGDQASSFFHLLSLYLGVSLFHSSQEPRNANKLKKKPFETPKLVENLMRSWMDICSG